MTSFTHNRGTNPVTIMSFVCSDESKVLQSNLCSIYLCSIGRTMWLDPLVERAVLRGINVTTNLNNVRLELLREGKAVENKQVM